MNTNDPQDKTKNTAPEPSPGLDIAPGTDAEKPVAQEEDRAGVTLLNILIYGVVGVVVLVGLVFGVCAVTLGRR